VLFRSPKTPKPHTSNLIISNLIQMSTIIARQDQSASLKSEKTRDIRATNIIAAKGKFNLLS